MLGNHNEQVREIWDSFSKYHGVTIETVRVDHLGRRRPRGPVEALL